MAASPVNFGEIALQLATAFIAIPSITLIFFVLGSLIGLQASPIYPGAATLLTVGALIWGVKRRTKSAGQSCVVALVFACLSGLALLFQSYVLDDTWDGFAYHEPYAMLIAGGTNPIYQWQRFEDLCCPNPPWLMTKGFESVAGCMLTVFHAIEPCKFVHSLPLFAALLLGWRFFCELLGDRKGARIWAFALAILSTFGPTVCTEFSTFLLDIDVSTTFNCVLFSLGLLVLNPQNKLAALACALSLVYFLNLKLTSIGYTATLVLMAGAAIYHNTKSKPALKLFASFALITSLFAIIVVGFNPYVLTINKVLGRPMRILKQHHELVQKVSRQFAPEALLNRPRSAPEKLMLGLFWDPSAAVGIDNDEQFSHMLQEFHEFSLAHNNLHFSAAPHDDGRMHLLSPLAFNGPAMQAYLDPCPPSLGGAGPLFGPLLLFSLGVLFFELAAAIKHRHNSPQQRLCFYMAAAISATVLSNPILWFSRYVPQLWLAPVIAAASCLTGGKVSKTKLVSGAAICLILFADLLMIEVPFWRNNLKRTDRSDKS